MVSDMCLGLDDWIHPLGSIWARGESRAVFLSGVITSIPCIVTLRPRRI